MAGQGMEEADGGVMAPGQLPSTAPVSLFVGKEDLPVKAGSLNRQSKRLSLCLLGDAPSPPCRILSECSVNSLGPEPTFCAQTSQPVFSFSFSFLCPFPFPLQEERVRISGHSINIS